MFVDVREHDEWQAGHLEGAIHCPLSELEKGHIPLNLPSDRPIYLYCARGRRAKIAKAILLSSHPLAVALENGYEELKTKSFTH